MSRILTFLFIAVTLPSICLGAFDADSLFSASVEFADTYFSADQESLFYVYAGGDSEMALAFVDSTNILEYISRNSACFGLSTNLPANCKINYGTSIGSLSGYVGYDERMHTVHIKHITGLDPSTKYYYQAIATDVRDSATYSISTAIDSFTTDAASISSARYIDGTGTFPQTLNSDSTYVLTGDVTVDARAFTFGGNNITLDLNGFTITYDNGSGTVGSPYTAGTVYGIVGLDNVSGTICNGRVVQGQTGSGSISGSVSYVTPIYFVPNQSNQSEIFGLDISWYGSQMSGLYATNGDTEVHHNIFSDRGYDITNRHSLPSAMNRDGAYSSGDTHHNLIKRSRHVGINAPSSGDVSMNEVYVDSWSTNAFCIRPHENTTVSNNFIFGSGYHAIGVGFPIDTNIDSLIVNNNFIFLQGITPATDRENEYGPICSMNGIRLTVEICQRKQMTTIVIR